MWSTQDIPDQTGRVAVITGANGGLGLASAKALAGKGAHVVMAARNQDKAAAAHDEIVAAHPGASLEIVELDLGSLASVEAGAKAITAKHDQIDFLLLNAGLMAMPEGTTADGFERQLGVNAATTTRGSSTATPSSPPATSPRGCRRSSTLPASTPRRSRCSRG